MNLAKLLAAVATFVPAVGFSAPTPDLAGVSLGMPMDKAAEVVKKVRSDFTITKLRRTEDKKEMGFEAVWRVRHEDAYERILVVGSDTGKVVAVQRTVQYGKGESRPTIAEFKKTAAQKYGESVKTCDPSRALSCDTSMTWMTDRKGNALPPEWFKGPCAMKSVTAGNQVTTLSPECGTIVMLGWQRDAKNEFVQSYDASINDIATQFNESTARGQREAAEAKRKLDAERNAGTKPKL